MESLSRSSLQALLAMQEDPCVSLYLPMGHTMTGLHLVLPAAMPEGSVVAAVMR